MNEEGRRAADEKADRDADGGERHHLQEIDAEDERSRCAETFERGDHGAFAVEIGLHRIGDADTADDKRRQTDKGKKQRNALHEAAHARRAVAPVADAPARIRKALVERGDPGGNILAGARTGGKTDAV